MRSTCRHGVSRFDGAWAWGRTGRALCVLAVLAAVAVPLAFAPSAPAAETGQITGKVTDALTGAAVTPRSKALKRTVVLRLTAAGRRMFAHAGTRHPIAARLTLSAQGGKAMSVSVLAV